MISSSVNDMIPASVGRPIPKNDVSPVRRMRDQWIDESPTISTTIHHSNALDLVFVRVGRVVIELHLFALSASDSAFEIQLARALAHRAH